MSAPRSIREHIALTDNLCLVCGVQLGLGLTMVQRAVGLEQTCLSCAQMMHSTPDDELVPACWECQAPIKAGERLCTRCYVAGKI